MNRQRVVITGMGVITPIGLNVEEFWSGLIGGKSGIVPISRFDTGNFPVKVAGEVTNFDPAKYLDPRPLTAPPGALSLASPRSERRWNQPGWI